MTTDQKTEATKIGISAVAGIGISVFVDSVCNAIPGFSAISPLKKALCKIGSWSIGILGEKAMERYIDDVCENVRKRLELEEQKE